MCLCAYPPPQHTTIDIVHYLRCTEKAKSFRSTPLVCRDCCQRQVQPKSRFPPRRVLCRSKPKPSSGPLLLSSVAFSPWSVTNPICISTNRSPAQILKTVELAPTEHPLQHPWIKKVWTMLGNYFYFCANSYRQKYPRVGDVDNFFDLSGLVVFLNQATGKSEVLLSQSTSCYLLVHLWRVHGFKIYTLITSRNHLLIWTWRSCFFITE